jgi:hypothetical protein
MRVCTDDLEQVWRLHYTTAVPERRLDATVQKPGREGQRSKAPPVSPAPHLEVQRDTPRATGHVMNDAPEFWSSALFIIKRGFGSVAGNLFSRDGERNL